MELMSKSTFHWVKFAPRACDGTLTEKEFAPSQGQILSCKSAIPNWRTVEEIIPADPFQVLNYPLNNHCHSLKR